MPTFQDYKLPQDTAHLIRIFQEDVRTSETVLRYLRRERGGSMVNDQWFMMRVIVRDGTDSLPPDIVREVRELYDRYQQTFERFHSTVAAEMGVPKEDACMEAIVY